MAVRPQHMHDGSIVERRLRPIYDWLDNGNHKKALQEAEKVLKKSPSLQAARALKALALFRLGKGPEAHAVLEALAEEKPSDDSTLQAMTISYRESLQFHKVCAIYEAAVKAEPTSEELQSHLFMSYVRVADYRAQQRAAMALYKFAPKNPYYFWAVMSVVLQNETYVDCLATCLRSAPWLEFTFFYVGGVLFWAALYKCGFVLWIGLLCLGCGLCLFCRHQTGLHI